MTQQHGAPGNPDDTPQPRTPAQKARATAIFVAVVGVVLTTFVVLGQQDPPPRMPRNDVHKLQLNLKGELVGLHGEAGLDVAMQPGFVLEKKTIEARVNKTCQSCHGAPAGVEGAPACVPGVPCLPPHHPPKTECIKCHRMAQ